MTDLATIIENLESALALGEDITLAPGGIEVVLKGFKR